MLCDISLCILDIAINSFKSGAKNISIFLTQKDSGVLFEIKDDGRGISDEMFKRIHNNIKEPETGASFNGLKGLYKACGDRVKIISDEGVGTFVSADFKPGFTLGDIAETVMCLINLSMQSGVRVSFFAKCKEKSFLLDSERLSEISGCEKLSEGERYAFIKQYVSSGISEVFVKTGI